MYKNYYSCLTSNIDTILECNELIGNPSDIVYQYTSYFFKIFLNINNFYWYLFFLAFIIYFSILYTTNKISPMPIVSISFLLVDFRFWEYGANILRAGLSITIFMWIFYYISKKQSITKKIRLIFFLPMLSHSSGIVFLFIKEKKAKFIFLLSSSVLALLWYINFNILFQTYGDLLLPVNILNKMNFYYIYHRAVDIEYSIPMHYILIIIFSLFFSLRGWITDKSYIYSTNILWILFLFSIIFSIFSMGYRIIVFMTPFISINFGFQLNYIIRKFKSVKIIIFIFTYTFILVIFLKNYEFIFKLL